ncbi:MAG: hypothetical protein NVS9B10_23110 [Nevskia sp.]
MRTPPRLLRLFSFAVIDQALLSGANFLLGFLLIRYTGGADYGMFVLAQATILLMIVAQGAWITGPIYVIAPKREPEQRRELLSAIRSSQHWLLRWLVLAGIFVPPIGYAFGLWNGDVALVSIATIFAAWKALLREYCRTVLLTYGKSRALLKMDAIYVAVLVGGALIALIMPRHAEIAGHVLEVPVALWAVLALMSAAWYGHFRADRALAGDPGWVPTTDARQHWRQILPLGVWSAAGAGIYWLFSQSYNYIIASQIGLEAVADVNATRMLLMPAILITVGVKGLLIPSAAGWLKEFGITVLLKRLALFVLGIAVLDLIYFAFIWLLRDWVTVDLMRRKITQVDELLLLWGAVALLGLARDVMQTALQALERFKIVAGLTGIGAIVSLSIMGYGLRRWGPTATLIGQVAGETVILIGIILLTLQSQRRAHALPQATVPP